MAKIAYELNRMLPRVDAGYGGNPFDPAQVSVDKALGRYGAVPPFIVPGERSIITQVRDADEIADRYAAGGIVRSVMPMRVKRPTDSEWTTLPLEPLVSVSGKNTIVRRTVAKSEGAGTVKELWCQDDYKVTIQGIVRSADESKYPVADVRWLVDLFNERQAVEVEQEMLAVLNIHWLAIEEVSFPHTKGMNYQCYTVKAYSDTTGKLLINI